MIKLPGLNKLLQVSWGVKILVCVAQITMKLRDVDKSFYQIVLYTTSLDMHIEVVSIGDL